MTRKGRNCGLFFACGFHTREPLYTEMKKAADAAFLIWHEALSNE